MSHTETAMDWDPAPSGVSFGGASDAGLAAQELRERKFSTEVLLQHIHVIDLEIHCITGVLRTAGVIVADRRAKSQSLPDNPFRNPNPTNFLEAGPRDFVDNMQQELPRLHKVLALLQRRSAELRHIHQQMTFGLATPVNRRTITLPQGHPLPQLPPEILSKIFLYNTSLQDDTVDISAVATEPSVDWAVEFAPFLVAAVCWSWRRAALGCKALWTYVALRVDRDDNMRLEKGVAYLRLRLQRCGPLLPLDIAVEFDHPPWQAYDRILPGLFSTFARWRHARIYFDDFEDHGCLIRQRLSSLRGPAPNLTTVNIACSRERGCWFRDTPWAQTHLLESYRGPMELVEDLVHCSRIKQLCAWSGDASEETWAFLGRCVNLESLDVEMSDGDLQHSSLSGDVGLCLPRLRNLILAGSVGVWEAVAGSEMLEFPALESLMLGGASIDALGRLFAGCPNVTDLVMRDPEIIEEVPRELARMTKIETCTVVDSQMDCRLFLGLAESANPIWPSLKKMVLRNCTFHIEQDFHAFEDFARARVAAGIPLEIELVRSRRIPDQYLDGLVGRGGWKKVTMAEGVLLVPLDANV